MARPIKLGVDYFPLDVKMDDEVELLESEHDLIGFGVLIKLYQRIYASNYWLKWDKKELIVFSKRVNVDKNEVNAIINTCLEWGIFDKNLFDEHQILTSSGIQKRFFKITERYKRVEIIEEFLLLDFSENENKNLVYVNINSINAYKSTQTKEKETKSNLKESIVWVVNYLNKICGTKYRDTTEKTKSLIIARINDGFEGKDFKTVIDKKHKDWVGTEHEKYLRPETLFGTKFEGYLNQNIVPKGTKPPDDDGSSKAQKQIEETRRMLDGE